MTKKDLYDILTTTGLPVAYDHFPDKAKVGAPCITYNVSVTSNFGADNKVYSPVIHVDIHLYEKIAGNEQPLVEAALSDIFWDKTETWENDEKVYHTIYEVIL